MSTTTFKNAKVGDKVFDTEYGWGSIKRILDDNIYPIQATFDKPINVNGSSYTLDGFLFWEGDLKPRLFYSVQDSINYEKPIKLINNIEVPAIDEIPVAYGSYYFPLLVYPFYYGAQIEDYAIKKYYLNSNCCYPFCQRGKQAAILHAKAMLGIKE